MASEPAYSVRRTYLLAAVATTIALVAFGLALDEARRVGGEMTAGAGVVALWPAILGGFSLALMFAAVALLSILSLRRDRAATTAKPIMVFVFMCFALTFVVPPIARIVIGSRLTRQGYAACPAIYERPIARVRWARSPTSCPIGRR